MHGCYRYTLGDKVMTHNNDNNGTHHPNYSRDQRGFKEIEKE
jgi:hypothetical protein